MRIRSSVIPLGVFLLTAVVQLPFFDLWFSFMDEGHMLQFADIGRKGGEFYRDATFYPLPGAFHFLAVAFDIFGPSVRLSRWIVLIEFALFVTILFVVLRRATGSERWALVGVFALWLYRIWSFPHWQMYSYSTTSLLVLLACIWTLLIYFDRRDLRWLGVSGLLYGLGVLCKQDYGAAAGLAIALAIWLFLGTESRSTRRPVLTTTLTFLLPAAAVGMATGLYYWQTGVLQDLLQFTVFNHFVGMGTYEYTEFPDLFPILGIDPGNRTIYSVVNYLPAIIFTTDWPATHSHFLFTDTGLYDVLIKLFFYGPQLLLAGSAIKLWLRRDDFRGGNDPDLRRRRLAEFVVFAFGCTLILLVWLNKPQDYVHLAVLYWPLVTLAVVHAHDLLSGHPRRKWIAALALCGPMLLLITYSGRLLYQFQAAHTVLVEGERAGIYVKPEEAEMLDEVVSYIRENTEPDEAVAALPYFPMALFLAERMGPHRSSYIVWPFPEIPDRDQAIVAAMEAKETDVVIYNFTQFQSFDPVWEHAPVLFEYLVDNFELDRVFNTMSWVQPPAALRRRMPDTEARGLSLIPPQVSGLSLYLEEAGVPPRPVPPDVRSVYVSEMLWPFRRVVALRPSANERKTVLSIPVRIPQEGAVFESAVAVHPQWWSRLPPSWIDFSVRLRDADRVTVLAQKRLKPASFFSDRGWFDMQVDLSPWAGQEVVLELVNEAESSHGETIWMGGWELPRLVIGEISDSAPPAAPSVADRDPRGA